MQGEDHEVQDGLRAAAMFAREALSEFTATPKENA